jgi:hypothetical protein
MMSFLNIFAEKIGIFDSAKLRKIFIKTLVCEQNAIFSPKIAENFDNNVDPLMTTFFKFLSRQHRSRPNHSQSGSDRLSGDHDQSQIG